MKSSEKVKYDIVLTNNITEKNKEDFINVQNEVFDTVFNKYKFFRKFESNIYGPSIIALAYFDDKCIGARAFWRNDINGLKSYQPCDTAVLKDYRGMGVFKNLTLKPLEIIEDDVLVYNFPNDNSYSGYIKMGWKLHGRKRYKIYNPLIDNKTIDNIEKKYINWLVTASDSDFNDNLFYTNINGSYYLLKKRRGNFYLIVGKLDKDCAIHFKRARFPICFVYSEKGYLGRGLVTVTRNCSENLKIPLYKIDTIF